MNIMMKRRKRSVKRFVLDEQEDDATNELLNNGASKVIEVFNTLGKKIYSSTNVNSINISDWESGIYLLKSGTSFSKFIKQ